MSQLDATPGGRITIDLATQTVTGPDGATDGFEIDALQKECLLEGLDDIDLTLRFRDRMDAFEREHDRRTPWLQTVPG